MCRPLHDIAYRNSPVCLEQDWSASARIYGIRAKSRHRVDWTSATHHKFVDGRSHIRSRSEVFSVEEATLRAALVWCPEAGSARLTAGLLPLPETVRVTEPRGGLHPLLSEIVQAMDW